MILNAQRSSITGCKRCWRFVQGRTVVLLLHHLLPMTPTLLATSNRSPLDNNATATTPPARRRWTVMRQMLHASCRNPGNHAEQCLLQHPLCDSKNRSRMSILSKKWQQWHAKLFFRALLVCWGHPPLVVVHGACKTLLLLLAVLLVVLVGASSSGVVFSSS